MALTITKSGPFFTVVGSAISFSTLRQNFVLSTTGSISASTLIRNAVSSETEPIVPDATENSGISSTRANLSLSQFRNSIKYYNVTHTGTETNYDISGSINWNGNLNKTIVKSVYLTGTYGSTNPTKPAASFGGDTQNVKLYVSGSILGAGGESASGNGGNALEVNSSTGAVTVIPTDTSKIYGGGGGGATGSNGLRGLNGACNYYSYYDAVRTCGTDPTCGSDFLNSKTADGECNCVTTSTDVWYDLPVPSGGGTPSGVSYSQPPAPFYAFIVTGFPSQPPICPDPNMPILMADGTEKRAGDVKVGDYVLTQHEKTFDWGKYEVTYVRIAKAEKYKLIFAHLSGNESLNKEVIVSESHSFHIKNDEWKNTWKLEVGDIIDQYELISSEKIGIGEVVRLEIDDAHTYVCCGFLSHNISKYNPVSIFPLSPVGPSIPPAPINPRGGRRPPDPPRPRPDPPRKSDMRLKTNIRPIGSDLNIIHKYWNI
jgi:hypothetical protein